MILAKINMKKKKQLFSYPFIGCLTELKESEQVIVAFTAPSVGAVLQGEDPIGTIYTEWVMASFERFEGEITLQND